MARRRTRAHWRRWLCAMKVVTISTGSAVKSSFTCMPSSTLYAMEQRRAQRAAEYNHHFKHMTTVGEPIEPAVWRWDVVGKGEAVIVDTWWQTENGGFLCSTVPALRPMKPGSAGPGVPGIHPIIYDEAGNEIPQRSGRAGNICIQNPWPGSFQTIWKDPDRYVRQYYERYCKNRNSRDWRDWPYMAGDGALQATDGYYRILGRIDDVINVAGHRLGTKEIESASLLVEEVAEAAVIPARDEIKGKVPDLYVSLKPGRQPSEEIRKRVENSVIREIGPIARPRRVVIVPDMPKTRSGKIMRRVLAAISNNEDAGDISTLANPEIVDEIRKMKF
jgi:acetyl-CoA synthetase